MPTETHPADHVERQSDQGDTVEDPAGPAAAAAGGCGRSNRPHLAGFLSVIRWRRCTTWLLSRLARVAEPVTIGIRLVRVSIGRTVVANLADTVAIGISLVGVGRLRTIVAGIAHTVAVTIGLIGVGHLQTIVAIVAGAVCVRGTGTMRTEINNLPLMNTKDDVQIRL